MVTKNFTVDTYIINTYTETFTIDAQIKGSTQRFTIDVNVEKRYKIKVTYRP